MIKAVIFDLGGVYFTDGTKIAVEKLSKKFNLQPDSLREIFKTGSELGTSYRRGEISADEFWNNAKRLLGIKADNKELSKIWVESYEPIEGTIRIVNRLKKRIKLYFLSDNVKERVEYLQANYNFLENFIDGIFSHIVHKTKLDGIDVFKLVLEKTGEKSENVVYIDDKEEYVETAKKLGMNAILFKNSEQLDEELRNLGL